MERRIAGPLNLEAEEFDAWRTHRTTVKVRRYLTDVAVHIREQWSRGEGWNEEMRRYVQDLDDLEGLDFESIETFYTYTSEKDDEQA